jgi:sarcosine oxidase delta subunit
LIEKIALLERTSKGDANRLDRNQNYLNSKLHLFPFSLPDEIHASQVGRYHRDSGNISTRHTYIDLYGTAPFRLSQWIPSNIEIFAEKMLGPEIENVRGLLLQNTLYPLFTTFGHATLSLTSDAAPIRDQIITMPKRIIGESGETHLCVQCLREDINDHETAFIHLSHQIPGVTVCWKHGTRLVSSCPFCGCPFEPRADLVLAPWEPCAACNHYLLDAAFYSPPTRATEQEWEFATFAYDLLQGANKPLDVNTLTQMYAIKIGEKHLSRGTTIDRAALFAALEEHFSSEFLNEVDSAYRTGRSQNWLRCCSKSGFFDAPISRHLLLASFLFGSSHEFMKAADYVLEHPRVPSNGESADPVTFSQESYATKKQTEATDVYRHQDQQVADSPPKQKIAAFIRENPRAETAELWKRFHGAMKQLHKPGADGAAWLAALQEAASPGEAEKTNQSDVVSGDDLSWAQKFATAALAFYSSSGIPVKVSRTRLMRKAGWTLQNLPNSDQFPLARKQLESLSESNWHYYARRILWAKLTVGTRATSASSVIIPSGIEHHRGLVLYKFFSAVPNHRKLRDGTISEILSEHNVEKDWEGPTPAQEFYTPGRNYVRRQVVEITPLTQPFAR